MATTQSAIDIMGEWFDLYRDLPDYQEFFQEFDVGIPLAYVCWLGMATPSENGISIIEQTWRAFCQLFKVDDQADPSDWAEFEDLTLDAD